MIVVYETSQHTLDFKVFNGSLRYPEMQRWKGNTVNKAARGKEDNTGRNRNTSVNNAASRVKASLRNWMQKMDYQAKAM